MKSHGVDGSVPHLEEYVVRDAVIEQGVLQPDGAHVTSTSRASASASTPERQSAIDASSSGE